MQVGDRVRCIDGDAIFPETDECAPVFEGTLHILPVPGGYACVKAIVPVKKVVPAPIGLSDAQAVTALTGLPPQIGDTVKRVDGAPFYPEDEDYCAGMTGVLRARDFFDVVNGAWILVPRAMKRVPTRISVLPLEHLELAAGGN